MLGLWQCPKLSREDALKLDRRKIRPITIERSEGPFLPETEQTSSWPSSEPKLLQSIADHDRSTSIIVRYRIKPIQALVDTGSDLTLAGLNLAKEHRWKIRPPELQAVKVANGESMPIHGIATEILTAGKKSVRSEIFITPNITDLILGIDWQRKQGSTIGIMRSNESNSVEVTGFLSELAPK